jgi:protein-L-isoaspartate O-methyltransferase
MQPSDGTTGWRTIETFIGKIYDACGVPKLASLLPMRTEFWHPTRLVQPVGRGGADEVVLFEKRGGVLERIRQVTGAHFVRLCGEHGFGS